MLLEISRSIVIDLGGSDRSHVISEASRLDIYSLNTSINSDKLSRQFRCFSHETTFQGLISSFFYYHLLRNIVHFFLWHVFGGIHWNIFNFGLWYIFDFLLRDILNTFLWYILHVWFLVIIRYIFSLVFNGIIVSHFFVFGNCLIIHLFDIICVCFLLRHVLHLSLDLGWTLRHCSDRLLINVWSSERLLLSHIIHTTLNLLNLLLLLLLLLL